MGILATTTFVMVLSGWLTVGASAPHLAASRSSDANAPCTTISACTQRPDSRSPAGARDRSPRGGVMPVVAYAVDATESIRADEPLDGITEYLPYLSFEPARIVRPESPRPSLLARMRRAASRILAATAGLPHF